MGPCSDRQATPGVTGLSRARVHIDHAVWYIAIGSRHPGGAGATKGWVVHPLKTHVSWVQNVARQFGGISKKCNRRLKGRIPEYERNGDSAPLVSRLSFGIAA